MKTFNIVFAVILLLSFSFAAQAQCDADKFMANCQGKISDGFTFLKSYTIDGSKGGKVEHSYVFSKDTTYLLSLCTENGDPKNMYVILSDSNRKELFNSYDKKSGKYMPLVGYRSTATGIYYLTFYFNEGADKCGGSVLAFKR